MEKVSEVRDTLNASEKTAMVISEPDEIAWLFNMRGEGESILDSLMVSPLFQSLALLTLDAITLWVHQEKVTQEIRNHLHQDDCKEENMCVAIGNYSNAIMELTEWAEAQPMVSKHYEYHTVLESFVG